jgi:hypothetical protein
MRPPARLYSFWRRLPAVLLALLALGDLTAAWPAAIRILDAGQGEDALDLVRQGETVRLYCKPCSEIAYSSLQVASRELKPLGDGHRLLLNGEDVDVIDVYVESIGREDEWVNLATLLGLVVKDRAHTLPRALRDVERLRPHLGSYRGLLGKTDVILELRLDGRALAGSYEMASGRRALRATAFNATREKTSLVLMERDDKNRGTGILKGHFDVDRLDPQRRAFVGAWTSLDGKRQERFEFVRTQVTRR